MPSLKSFERLPTTVRPRHYRLTLNPDLAEFTFTGSVEIDLEIKECIDSLKLNSKSLEIKDCTLTYKEKKYPISNIDVQPLEQVAVFNLSEKINPGDALLKIEFSGSLNDKMMGFYRSAYTLNGESKFGAVTQFELADARMCFPCWDEPAIKAKFDVTLIAPSHLVTLSNMPEISRIAHPTESSKDIIKFDTTPIMSTYLLAVVIGEYDFVEGISGKDTKVRVYTPIGKKDYGKFALEVAIKSLEYFTDYFKVSYPLPKMDLIAIADFSMGAMENWGLITYRERMLLYDPENSSTVVKTDIAVTVAHEVAHQWFGNLVTMEWWTHLWLNEGYATFTSYLVVDDLFPELDIWTDFAESALIRSLKLDSLRSSHPIEVPVGAPEEVEEIFDTISYCKGASTINMLCNYLGSEDFKAGMHLYLDRHKYSNTETKDLWKALEDSSNKPVGKVMPYWTEQIGHPVITVSSREDGDKQILKFHQQRFLTDGTKDSTLSWHVPIRLSSTTSPKSPFKEFLLDSETCNVEIDKDAWIKVNTGAVGFYRTRYSSEMLSQLHSPIASKVLPPSDRLIIIDDLFALAEAGYHSAVDVLKLLVAYEEETNYIVWCSICSILHALKQLLAETAVSESFSAFGRKQLRRIVDKVGWDAKPDENNLDKMLRGLVLRMMGSFGDEEILKESKKRFAAHVNGASILPADLRSVVYKNVSQIADRKIFDQMIKLHNEAELQEEKLRISCSLGNVRNPDFIQPFMEFAMSDAVRNQDTIHVLTSLGVSVQGRNAVWAFFKSNLKEFKSRFEGGNLLMYFVSSSLEHFSTDEMAEDVDSFFKENPLMSTERKVQQALEGIRLRAAFLRRDSTDIEKFLQTQ